MVTVYSVCRQFRQRNKLWLQYTLCAGSLDRERSCGRPFGLRLDKAGRLLAADAYLGIFRINTSTGIQVFVLDSISPLLQIFWCVHWNLLKHFYIYSDVYIRIYINTSVFWVYIGIYVSAFTCNLMYTCASASALLHIFWCIHWKPY